MLIRFFRSALFLLYRAKRAFSYLIVFVVGYSVGVSGLPLTVGLFNSVKAWAIKFI